ncbi:MAG: DNA-3-methyladenine glycosylase I [Candidatus Omnitrophica bacterium]|nr:DNA-3-methyladenine glycosylase I [Candidatus Omnitrophota bacterium]
MSRIPHRSKPPVTNLRSSKNISAAFLKVQKEFGTFERYIRGFVGQKPIQNRLRNFKELPARTEKSDIISKDLKERGFNFAGSTIMYAFMQAVGRGSTTTRPTASGTPNCEKRRNL